MNSMTESLLIQALQKLIKLLDTMIVIAEKKKDAQ
jgi:hypothetical protein